jgi:tRNA-specific 2-thiouridylase
MDTNNRVLVAMSGGVDSSVTAYLLKRQGYECVGATMRLIADELLATECGVGESTCCSKRDIDDARAVAAQLGIPHLIVDLQDEFADEVVNPFVDDYLQGRTPNPCIECNRHLKFEHLLSLAEEIGCDRIATGHYARIESTGDGLPMLLRGSDPGKDQSYVLHVLTPEQLQHTLFPLGALTKQEVREVAEWLGFGNARKGDSQDICFIPDGDYASFIERYTEHRLEPGDILDTHGNVIGRHDGAARFTIGQRKGIGVALGKPVYVCAKDMTANTVTVGTREHLMTDGCIVDRWNTIAPNVGFPCAVQVKTHYRQKPLPAVISRTSDSAVMIEYDDPHVAAVPGQSAVAYLGDRVIGGGIIRSPF